MKKFYDLQETVRKHPSCQYYIVWGSRGSGKSYSAMKMLVDDFFLQQSTFVIAKRYILDLKTKVCSTMFLS